METAALDQNTIEAEADARLPQPSQSRLSAIINGMGNGAMIGGATYVALPKLYNMVAHHAISEAARAKGSVFATVAGAALGTWYGFHEAKQLETYRDSIGKEIITLRERVHKLEGKHGVKHVDALDAERDQAAIAPTR